MDDYNEYVKKKRTIRYAILLVVCIVVSFVAGMLVWRGTHIDHSKDNIERYAVYVDEVTGEKYTIESMDSWKDITIPYDRSVHTFICRIYSKKTKKLLADKRWTLTDEGEEIKEPGEYYIRMYHSLDGGGYKRYFGLGIIVEEPTKRQPEMRFDPNGAIEYIDGEYYKYTYTREPCYPIAYGWYNGKRLDANVSADMLITRCVPDYAPDTTEKLPRKMGTYSVNVSIGRYADDPNGETYAPVRKTITVQIVL